MKFLAETQLVEVLKTSLKNIYTRDCVKIFEEVSLGYGIADIVVSDLKKTACQDSRSEQLLDLFDINIYSLVLKSEGLAISDVINITRCSKQAISRSLCKLLDNGYVINDENRLVANRFYEFPCRNNFAIEAKLKDWKRALKQAYRYKWFAEYSFVVLDAYYAKAALKNREYFVKYNVGLASISPDGTLQRHFNPIRQAPFDLKMQILFSEKVKHHALSK